MNPSAYVVTHPDDLAVFPSSFSLFSHVLRLLYHLALLEHLSRIWKRGIIQAVQSLICVFASASSRQFGASGFPASASSTSTKRSFLSSAEARASFACSDYCLCSLQHLPPTAFTRKRHLTPTESVRTSISGITLLLSPTFVHFSYCTRAVFIQW